MWKPKYTSKEGLICSGYSNEVTFPFEALPFRVDNNATIYMKTDKRKFQREVTVAYSKCSTKVTIPYSVRNEPLSALIKQQDPEWSNRTISYIFPGCS